MNLTEIEYWKELQGEPCVTIGESNIIYQWVQRNFHEFGVDHVVAECFEIGCYPGRYLGMMAQRGFAVGGLDYIPAVIEIEPLLREGNMKTCEFYCSDFRKFSESKKYDLVYSLGFIEHFLDWDKLLKKQIDLVKPGGFLLVEVPNFRGVFQKLPRWIFDRDDFQGHNLAAMDLTEWAKIAEGQGLEVLAAEPIGGYGLWFVRKPSRWEGKLRSWFVFAMRAARKVCFPKIKNHSAFSSAFIMLARKPL